MYFGSTAFKAQNNTITESILDFGSVVYNEYLNRKSMLEACTDETQKPLLEAQVECLCEASIKDIFTSIKKFIESIIEKIKKFIKNIKDKLSNKDLKDKIAELEKENETLKKANDILKGKNADYKNMKDQNNYRQEEIARNNERFNELFETIEDNLLLFYSPDDYINDSFTLSNMVEAIFPNTQSNWTVDEPKIKSVNDSIRNIFIKEFNDCFKEEERTIYTDRINNKIAEVKILSEFDSSKAKQIFEKLLKGKKEYSGRQNDFIWLADKIKAAAKAYDGDKLYNALYRVEDALETLNKRIEVNRVADSDTNSFTFGVAQIVKSTISTLNGCVTFITFLDQKMIERRQFLITSSKNLLTMCKALKGQTPGEAEPVLRDLVDDFEKQSD